MYSKTREEKRTDSRIYATPEKTKVATQQIHPLPSNARINKEEPSKSLGKQRLRPTPDPPAPNSNAPNVKSHTYPSKPIKAELSTVPSSIIRTVSPSNPSTKSNSAPPLHLPALHSNATPYPNPTRSSWASATNPGA